MKNVKLSTAILMCVCTASLTTALTLNIYDKTLGLRSSEMYSVLAEANSITKNFFYKDIDESEITDGIIRGYVSGLDDNYARYQSLSEHKINNQSDNGYFVGIGVTITQTTDGYLEVTDFSDNSSASEAGMLKGDIITEIDGNDISEIGYNETLKMIKSGDTGKEVLLKIKRGEEQFELSVERREITIVTSSGQMLDENIGYIAITQFNNTTPDQMKETYNKLISEGAKRIIFDLRNNPGGMVKSVEKCLDPFLPEGDIAVANYNNGQKQVICRSDAEETDIPIVILINENSASGAELFSAAMRDFGKAVLVGTKSYGKGIMQNTYTLKNGGAITFTVAEYQTTKSDCYHGIGIYPDYEVEKAEGDNVLAIDVSVDAQLKKAVEIVKEIKN